jgi:hypothetical protein
MSEFKNLSDEDVLRIERGIVYSFPARGDDGVVVCIGKYGDLSNQVRARCGLGQDAASEMASAFKDSQNRMAFWFSQRVDDILSGKEVYGSNDWKIAGGKPVMPPYIAPLAGGGYIVDEAEQGFQAFMRKTGYSNLPEPEIQELRAAYRHGQSGCALAPWVSLPQADDDGNIYGLPERLFTETKGMGTAFHDHVKYLAAQANVKGEQNLLEGRIASCAKQLGLI